MNNKPVSSLNLTVITMITMDKKSIFLLIFIFSMVNCRQNPRKTACKVIEEKTKSIKECLFPFRFKNKLYYGCTEDGFLANETPYPWCSTKVGAVDMENHGSPNANAIETRGATIPGFDQHVVGGQYYGECTSKSKCVMHHESMEVNEKEEFLFFPMKTNTLQ